MKCLLCNKDIDIKGFASHVNRTHHMKVKNYYDKYIRTKDEGVCPVCGRETTFYGMNGYATYHLSCVNKDPAVREKIVNTNLDKYGFICNLNIEEVKEKAKHNSQTEEAKEKRAATNLSRYGATNVYASEEIKERIKQTNQAKYNHDYSCQADEVKEKIAKTCQEKYGASSFMKSKEGIELYKRAYYDDIKQFIINNEVTLKADLEKLYGTGWYQEGIVKIIKHRGVGFVKNSDIPKIIQYVNESHTFKSHSECSIVGELKTVYDSPIVENTRNLIHPYEIDIYLPDIKLAVEYNGKYWHSIEFGKSTDYHLAKSLRCREKGIRLVHIYEFEDFEHQLELLKDLIQGVDNYPKNDFNKNNLLDEIPEPEIIYDDGALTVYGAGKLYS